MSSFLACKFSDEACLTIDGDPLFGMVGQVGVPCKFPFKFLMTYGPYDGCVSYSGNSYCATEVDSNGNAVSIGVCDPSCSTSVYSF